MTANKFMCKIICFVLLIFTFIGNSYACQAQISTYSSKPWIFRFVPIDGSVYVNMYTMDYPGFVDINSIKPWPIVYKNQFTVEWHYFDTLPMIYSLDYVENKNNISGYLYMTDYRGTTKEVVYAIPGSSACPVIVYDTIESLNVMYFNIPGDGDILITKDSWPSGKDN